MKITILQLSIAFVMFFLYGKVQAQTDGTLDTSFNIGTGFNYPTLTIASQSDGKILVGGHFISYSGTTQNYITRLNTDGTLDTSFNIEAGFYGSVRTITLQSDGKILVGGDFGAYNGISRNKIARLNANGTLDSSFDIGTGMGMDKFVYSTALQPDGKILVGGYFTSYNETTQNSITRLNMDGTLDTSFTIGTGLGSNGYCQAIALQSDGKILVGGYFTSYNEQAQNHIVRLNTDGTLDTSFTIGTGFNFIDYAPVVTIVIQPDGKILVGGYFTSYNGQTQNRIVRLNSDGTLDTSFNIGTGFDGSVVTIMLQPDGKILVGGGFTSYNGTPQHKIVRLNANGDIDTSFTIGTGFGSGYIIEIALQSDGKILAGGLFTSYNGTTQNNITRLHNENTAGIEDFNNADIKIYPNPVKDILYFEKEVQKITLTDLTGKVLSIQRNSSQTDMSNFQKGAYLITIEQEKGVKEIKKVIKL